MERGGFLRGAMPVQGASHFLCRWPPGKAGGTHGAPWISSRSCHREECLRGLLSHCESSPLLPELREGMVGEGLEEGLPSWQPGKTTTLHLLQESSILECPYRRALLLDFCPRGPPGALETWKGPSQQVLSQPLQPNTEAHSHDIYVFPSPSPRLSDRP